MFWKYVVFVLVVTTTTRGDPFVLTDKFVEEFQNGLDGLVKAADGHVPIELSLDETKLDVEEAAKHEEKYDFIVVGSGTSGSVLAARLSEVPEWKVLVLEAGAPESPSSLVPAMGTVVRRSPYVWGYQSEALKTACLGLESGTCPLNTGKAIGGTSAINSMVYTRGNKKDYDLWADNGNDGWCYDDVVPYFKRQEDAILKEFDHKYHNQGGPLHVEHPQYLSPISEVFMKAAKELHFEEVDYNGKQQLGASIPQVTTRHGKRDSTSQAYLVPNIHRKNLAIKPFSEVVQVIISPHTKEATGVKYIRNGKLHIAKADKEVILTTGAIATPKLLMQSGVGPKEELEKHKIELHHESPTGLNLKTHVTFLGVNYYLNDSTPEIDRKQILIEYLKNHQGLYTSPGIEGIAFMKSKSSKDQSDYPDIQLQLLIDNLGNEMKNKRVKKEIYDSIWKPTEGKASFTIAVTLLHPKSTGKVSLKSKDLLNHPLIHTNVLSDPEDHDVERIMDGIRKALSFEKTDSFHKHNLVLNNHQIAGCDAHKFESDEYWKCAIKHLTIVENPIGTTKMGAVADKEAVVDHTLKVHGVKKLRVADGSVIPVHISGDTSAALVMIGEKAGDLIKQDWKHKI